MLFLILTASLAHAETAAEALKKRLTPEQYHVTQEDGTERPFSHPYNKLKDEGIYVDVVTGEALFSSKDKYDSGTGWPSFTKPITPLKTKIDMKLGGPRKEIRSGKGDSHLGHVFDDGPGPGGQRFCVNGSALRFVPKARMKEEGYGAYLPLFN
jgi:methionine-R-sulfoxide reductase